MLLELLNTIGRYFRQNYSWVYGALYRQFYTTRMALQNPVPRADLDSVDKSESDHLEQKLIDLINSDNEAEAIKRLQQIKQGQEKHTVFSNIFYESADQISKIIDSKGESSQKLFNLILEHCYDGNILEVYKLSKDEPEVTRKTLEALKERQDYQDKLGTPLDVILFHGGRNLEAFNIISPYLPNPCDGTELVKRLLLSLETSKDGYHQSEKGQKDFAFYAAVIDKLCESPECFLYDWAFKNLPRPTIPNNLITVITSIFSFHSEQKGGLHYFIQYLSGQSTNSRFKDVAILLIKGGISGLLTDPAFPKNDEDLVLAQSCIAGKFTNNPWKNAREDALKKFVNNQQEHGNALNILMCIKKNITLFKTGNTTSTMLLAAAEEAFNSGKYKFLRIICNMGRDIGSINNGWPLLFYTPDSLQHIIKLGHYLTLFINTHPRGYLLLPQTVDNVLNGTRDALITNNLDVSGIANQFNRDSQLIDELPEINLCPKLIQASTISIIGLENADTIVALSRTCKAIYQWVRAESDYVTTGPNDTILIPGDVMEIIVKYAAHLPVSYKVSQVYKLLNMGSFTEIGNRSA